jgi:Mn2+/Fe2+ NRAMP family transporter
MHERLHASARRPDRLALPAHPAEPARVERLGPGAPHQIIPAVIVTALYGERGAGGLLILSQVILSLQLSFAVVPLVLFTGERRKMGEFANGQLLSAVAWSVAVAIVGLNAWLLIGTARAWLA